MPRWPSAGVGGEAGAAAAAAEWPERLTHAASLSLALLLHLLLIYFAGKHYGSALTNPERANIAAQTLLGASQKPTKFVYVKDLNATKEPPLDPTRLSDRQRRGASPDGGKGTSPDPYSLGPGTDRTIGGPRPGVGAAPQPPPGGRARPLIQPNPGGSPGHRISPAGPADVTPNSKPPDRGHASDTPPEERADSLSLPAPLRARDRVAEKAGAEAPSGMGTGGQPQPGSQPVPEGLGGQIQQMYLGSMQGGYNNPNASKLNSGAVSFDTAAWDLGPYARRVQERVQSNWRIPEAQEILRQKGWVSIHFTVNKSGRISDVKVIRPSGIPSYDQAAMNALLSSDPLPPLPEEVTVPSITGTFRFFYFLPIPDEE